MSTTDPAAEGGQPTLILEGTPSPLAKRLASCHWYHWVWIVAILLTFGDYALRHFIIFASGQIWGGWTFLQDYFCGCVDPDIYWLYLVKYVVFNGIAWLMLLFILETLVTYLRYNRVIKNESQRKN